MDYDLIKDQDLPYAQVHYVLYDIITNYHGQWELDEETGEWERVLIEERQRGDVLEKNTILLMSDAQVFCLPDSIVVIQDEAFSVVSLRCVELHDTYREIGNLAF